MSNHYINNPNQYHLQQQRQQQPQQQQQQVPMNQPPPMQIAHNFHQQNPYPMQHAMAPPPPQFAGPHHQGSPPPPPPQQQHMPQQGVPQHGFAIPQGIPPQSQQQNYALPPPQSIISNIKDIPPSFQPFAQRSVPATTTTTTTTTLQTPKKKRGRPPKPNSLAQKITTTLNINVNTSPLNSNPAESNSNSMVKRGAPDTFTPLMRVSPTHMPKKRRKSSVSSSGSPSLKKTKAKTSKKTTKQTTNDNHPPHLVTPLSSSTDAHFPTSEPSYQINYKTLDKLSMVTQSQGYYNTPPPTSTNHSFSTPGQLDNLSNSSSFPTPIEQAKDTTYSTQSPPLAKISESKQESPSKNLLPPVSLSSNSAGKDKLRGSPIKEESLEPNPASRDNTDSRRQSAEDFSFKLTIDGSGKAVLSGDMFAPTKQHSEPVASHPESPRESPPPHSPTPSRSLAGAPALVHTNSVIGIEKLNSDPPAKAPLRRHNSDITNSASSTREPVPSLSSINESVPTNNPQTPKDTYTYVSTGLTPLFNLTPSFNALMYSVMNLNGSPPPLKRGNNPFLVNQEIFTGCGDSQQSQPQQLEELVEQPHLEEHQEHSGIETELDTHKDGNHTEMVQNSYSSNSSDDSGDARLALKKIIHVKRR